MRQARKPDIMADAAYADIHQALARSSPAAFSSTTLFSPRRGVTDFDRYRVDPTQTLAPTSFVPDDIAPPEGVEAWTPARAYRTLVEYSFTHPSHLLRRL